MQPVKHGLNDDHRTIDDQSEIQRPQAHEISRHPERIHHANGEHHRQRNDGGNDQPGAQVAEEEYKDQDDDQCPFEQIGLHRTDGPVHHFRPIQEGFYQDPLRQCPADLIHPNFDRIDHGGSIFSLKHQHDRTGHFPFVFIGHGPITHGMSNAHPGDIPDKDGYARWSDPDGDPTDLLQTACEALRTDEQQRRPLFNIRTT